MLKIRNSLDFRKWGGRNPFPTRVLGYLNIKKFTRKSAFTLAEVLITLGIIGVIAAITIPGLMTKYKRTVAEIRLKKAYSVVNQAFGLAAEEYGDVDSWPHENPEKFMKEFLATKVSGVTVYPKATDSRKAMCYRDYAFMGGVTSVAQYAWLSGGYISTPMLGGKTVSMSLPDGTCVGINTNTAGGWPNHVFIDINGGIQGPNRAGHDLFIFLMKDNRIVPYGYEKTVDELKTNCHKRGQGYSCAALVMQQGWKITYW